MLFKEFGGVDAWPICLDTKDTDEIVAIVKAHRARLRRHQPRGHLGAALLRDRGAPARGARHPGLPRRPARHRDRRARGAAQRAQGRRQADRGRQGRDHRASARRASPSPTSCSTPGVRTVSAATARARSTTGGRASTRSRQAFAERTNPDGAQGTADEVLAGADVFLGLSAPGAVSRAGDRADGRRRDRLRDGQPDARDRARRTCRREGRGRRDRPLRLPEPDQQRARVPGCLPRRARRAREHDHRGDEGRRRPCDRRGDPGRRARARVRDPERLQPGRRAASRPPSPRRPSATASRAAVARTRRRRASALVLRREHAAGVAERLTRTGAPRAG